MSLILVLKLILVPSLIGAVTLAGRRWGPAIAGWLSGFPIVAGPILFFIAWEQGPLFGAHAALGTILAIPAVLSFNIAYAWTAVRHNWFISLCAGMSCYVISASFLMWLAPVDWASVAICAASLAAAPRLFPSIDSARGSASPAKGMIELAYRMAAAAALVVVVTGFAADMGARISGLLAMFPIISIVLATFSHHHAGAAFAIRLLRSVVLGWNSLAIFFLLLYLLLPRMPTVAAFGAALLVAALVQFAARRRIIA